MILDYKLFCILLWSTFKCNSFLLHMFKQTIYRLLLIGVFPFC